MNPKNSAQIQPERAASPEGSPSSSAVPHVASSRASPKASPSPSETPDRETPSAAPEKQDGTASIFAEHGVALAGTTPTSTVAAAGGTSIPAAVTPLNGGNQSQQAGTPPVVVPRVKSPPYEPVAPAPAASAPVAPNQATPAPASAPASVSTSVGAPAQGGANQKCANCGATQTPLWRRGLKGEIMCNACGLYVKSRNISRPTTLNRAPNTRTIDEAMGSCPGGGQCNGMGGAQACGKCPTFNNRVSRSKQAAPSNPQVAISCQNCGTVTTPLWRRDNEGNTICNACGLYLRMHHEHRPVQMLKNTIKRRRRGDEDKSPRSTHSPAPIDFNQESSAPLPAPAVTSPMAAPHMAQGPQQQLHQGRQGTPQLPQGVLQGVPQGVSQGVSQVPQGIQRPHVSQGAPQQGPVPVGLPQGVPQGVPQVPPGLPHGVPAGLPAGLPAGVTAPPPGLYQPLSLLSYLPSGDSKKEYLLAVRRQLQDKAAQCEAQLKQYIEHLRQCDEAIGESER